MLNIPAEAIDSWPEPNYEDPEFQGPRLAVIGIILLTITITVVALRLWVRLSIKKSAGWDDWITIAAMVYSNEHTPQFTP